MRSTILCQSAGLLLLKPNNNRNRRRRIVPFQTFMLHDVRDRTIDALFDEGNISSDAGLLQLQRIDEAIRLTHALAKAFADGRWVASVKHEMCALLAQRIYALCCGWKDVTNHKILRHELALQAAVGRVQALASGPTLCCPEAAASLAHTAALHGVLLDQSHC